MRELRSAVEMFASFSAVQLSCLSAMEWKISISTTVGIDGVSTGGFGGLSYSSSVFMGSVSDGDLVVFVAKSVGSREGVFVVLEA